MKRYKKVLLALPVVAILSSLVFADNETWTYCNASGNLPLGRWAHTAIYDEAHERMIVFGGVIYGGQRVGDMWALDGNSLTWLPLSANNQGPIALAFHTAIYNPVDTTMVLFSGATELDWNITNIIWVLNLNTLLWEQISPSYPAPSPRMNANAVYGPGDNQMLIFAGRDFESRFNDMWIYDFNSNSWQEILYASNAPRAREGASIILIDNGDRLLAHAGYHTCIDFYDDVWTFDFNTNTWMPHSLPVPYASPRAYGSLIYDSANNRALIFGGINSYDGNGLNDLWELDLATMFFSSISPMGDIPAYRGRHTTVVGGFAGHMAAIFGGAHYYTQVHNDTYFLDWDVITGLGDDTQVPIKVSTLKCYPNPFNSKTTIEFTLSEEVKVGLAVYDIMGREIKTLIDEREQAGSHFITFDASDLSSGVYYFRLEMGDKIETIRTVLLK